MRHLYSLIWGLSLPFALLRLWWRGRQEPGYRRHVAERLGFFRREAARPTLWVHAVSAGETRAAEPLIRALLAAHPQHRILLSHMTATGRETSTRLFADAGARLTPVFLPYDINWMMRRFIRHFRPEICILIETEVWPNLVAQCRRRRVPLALVNARLSEKSLKKALKMPALMLPAAQALDCVAAQSGPDAARLQQLGVAQPGITGNMKFDVSPPPQMAALGTALRRCFGARAVILCASTREGEEELLLDAWQAARPDALLVLTPRHPQRFDQVAAMLAARGLRTVRRSALVPGAALPGGTEVVLGDSMGEMYMYYAACDIAFIGGSLVPLGGHNLIEACAMRAPVLIGPHTFNFSEITGQAIAAGAAVHVDDGAALFARAAQLLADPAARQRMGDEAHAFFLQHQGATARTLALLKPHLPPVC